jgi:hypothetical protein
MFFTISNAPKAPTRRVQIFFGHQKNGALPIDLVCPKRLNVIIATLLQLNLQPKEQLRNLTHMFFL